MAVIPGGRWTLSQRAFDGLLERLGPDRERAGERYELMRFKLIKFFEWRGSPWPEDDADETIDRVTRKLDEGEAVSGLENYAHGVARLVLLETLREQERASAAWGDPAWTFLRQPASPEGESWTRALETCLRCLPPADRELIVTYHSEEGVRRIEVRRSLAERLGVSATALRIRAHRTRERLAECLRGRLAGPPRSPGSREG